MLPAIGRGKSLAVGPSLDDFIEKFFYGWPRFELAAETTWAPRVDVRESDKEIVVEAELPGVEQKDIKVNVANNVLTISGERRGEEKTEKKGYSRIERHYGKFERSFGLPETVNADKVSAEFKNGVLTLTLPKTEKAKPKEINVAVK